MLDGIYIAPNPTDKTMRHYHVRGVSKLVRLLYLSDHFESFQHERTSFKWSDTFKSPSIKITNANCAYGFQICAMLFMTEVQQSRAIGHKKYDERI
jgi:hypothetical protein